MSDRRDALERAALHARSAGSEALAALRVIGEALPQPSARDTLLALLRGLEQWLERMGSTDLGALRRALHDALETEIRRWEARSTSDADARTVLRAFLAVREALWDLGVRPPEPDTEGAASPQPARAEETPPAHASPPAAGGAAPQRAAPGRRRAQHVPVRG